MLAHFGKYLPTFDKHFCEDLPDSQSFAKHFCKDLPGLSPLKKDIFEKNVSHLAKLTGALSESGE